LGDFYVTNVVEIGKKEYLTLCFNGGVLGGESTKLVASSLTTSIIVVFYE